MALGDNHACALLSTGTLACWGDDSYGQLGNGVSSSAMFKVPIAVPSASVSNATAVVAAGRQTCALTGDTWTCWGFSGFGQLGAVTAVLPPTAFISAATVLAMGGVNTCMVVSGAVECTGRSDDGVLTTNFTSHDCYNGSACASTPVQIVSPLFSGVTAMSVAREGYFACALVTGGRPVCWGVDSAGELGPSGPTSGCTGTSCTPVTVPGVTGAVAITTGDDFACALLQDGTVDCWGDNTLGQLGSTEAAVCENSTTPCSSSPLSVNGLAGVTQIAAGDDFVCALLSDGTVDCWGNNDADQLGSASVTCFNMNETCSATPVKVAGVTGATAIAAGQLSACALLQTGGVVCWGTNKFGQIGNDAAQFASTAVPVQF